MEAGFDPVNPSLIVGVNYVDGEERVVISHTVEPIFDRIPVQYFDNLHCKHG